MGFDLISDLHSDFYFRQPPDDDVIKAWIEELLPENPNNLLLIGGDLGHDDSLNIRILKQFRSFYPHILVVLGNHDLYVPHGRSSTKRFNTLKEKIQLLPGVQMLDGTTVTIDGITYGGTMMWYDFSYGQQHFGLTLDQMTDVWLRSLNDSIYIHDFFADSYAYFVQERKKLEKVIPECDVILTHVGPDASKVPSYYHNPVTGCFYFDGAKMITKMSGKIWCFGHSHDRVDYERHSCRLINAALGYPHEQKGTFVRKIVTIE